MTDFIFNIVSLIMITAGFLAGQQLLLFDLGILCLGSASFFAIGAYSSAILSKYYGIDPALSVVVAGLTAMTVSIIVGYPLLKFLKKDFFAIATLGLAQSTFVILRSVAPGGSAGLAGIPPFRSPLNTLLPDSINLVLTNSFFGCLSIWAIWWFRKRRIGMLVTATRLDDNALSIQGYRPVLIKVEIFAISALLAGFAGALQAHCLGVVDPRLSSIHQTVLILCGTILSGNKTIWGTLLGASFLVILPEVLQKIFSVNFGSAWQIFPIVQIIYGIFIISVALWLFPRVRSVLRYDSDETR